MSVEAGGFSRVHRKQRPFPGSELLENPPGAPLHANAACDVTAEGVCSLIHSPWEAVAYSSRVLPAALHTPSETCHAPRRARTLRHRADRFFRFKNTADHRDPALGGVTQFPTHAIGPCPGLAHEATQTRRHTHAPLPLRDNWAATGPAARSGMWTSPGKVEWPSVRTGSR